MRGSCIVSIAFVSQIVSQASLLNDIYIKNLAFDHTTTFIHRYYLRKQGNIFEQKSDSPKHFLQSVGSGLKNSSHEQL